VRAPRTGGRWSPVVELRQYTLIRARDAVIDLFERGFVEGQEAVGMKVIGQFRDRDDQVAVISFSCSRVTSRCSGCDGREPDALTSLGLARNVAGRQARLRRIPDDLLDRPTFMRAAAGSALAACFSCEAQSRAARVRRLVLVDASADGPPRLPGDAEDDAADEEADQRVSGWESGGDQSRARYHAEADVGVGSGVVAVGHESGAVEPLPRSQSDPCGEPIADEADRPRGRQTEELVRPGGVH
jgi:hypothetical protein